MWCAGSQLLMVDPKKRPTAEQMLDNPWVKGVNAGSDNVLPTSTQLRKYNATRKLKKVAQGIIASKRIEGALAALQGAASS